MPRREPAKMPDGFERYDVTRTEAARLIGVSVATLDRWVEEKLIGYLRRPDGAVRFRVSDCYRAAGVPIPDRSGDSAPALNPQAGASHDG